jgi:glycosyltransferase involved in cell wall biosynthesis
MSDKKVLDVDVICANYNNARFLDDFFSSVVSLTHNPKKLIFIDDGSTDNSLEIVERYLDVIPFLNLIKLEVNQGFGNALNAGIENSTAKYIARMDPDDIFFPTRLIKQYELLESTSTTVVGSNAEIFHSDTKKTLSLSNFPTDSDYINSRIKKGEHGVLHPTVMASADLFKRNRYIQSHVPAEDYDIFARFLKDDAIFSNIDEPLIRYRVHQKSASNILPYSTIKMTYQIRDQLFGTKTKDISIILYYIHIKNYRKLLFETNYFKRLSYTFLACLVYPSKSFSRIKRYLGFNNVG